jgi:Small protein from certain CxC ATPase-based DNA modification systems
VGLDAKITEAIQVAVKEAGQSTTLARRLIAWLEAVTSGNEDIDDLAVSERHLDVLYADTSTDGEQESES